MSEVWVTEARARGWVVLSPVAPGGVMFFEGAEELVPEFLRMVRVRYQPQGGRFMLAGISNGGISAFRVAGRNPELFYSLTVLPGFRSAPTMKQRWANLSPCPSRCLLASKTATG